MEIVRGEPNIQGSYAEVSVAINLSQLLGFVLIREALFKFKSAPNPNRSSEGVVFDSSTTRGEIQRAMAKLDGVQSTAGLPIIKTAYIMS